jgi:hypothetical protein
VIGGQFVIVIVKDNAVCRFTVVYQPPEWTEKTGEVPVGIVLKITGLVYCEIYVFRLYTKWVKLNSCS